MTKPDLVILGQCTIDHVVPARPGPWVARLGGNALYAAAGARLWLDPERIGVVSRLGSEFPFDVRGLLGTAGITSVALRAVPVEHLVEWILYEEDGSRRCLPRNRGLQHIGTEGGDADTETYLLHLLQMSPTAVEIPDAWLPAPGVHLAPQVGDRHPVSLAHLRRRAAFVSVDPSPFYSRSRDAVALRALLPEVSAFLPSALEIGHLARDGDWLAAARGLIAAGFPEVVLKRGREPIVAATPDARAVPVPIRHTEVVDPTGAGDAFCGAYAACRLLALPPVEAARRAAIAAALIVGTAGVEAALGLDPSSVED